MKPEIKQRIEQIRRGEVPEGYKKSPFGILPIDWKIKKLSEVLIKKTRKNQDNSIHNVLTNSATQGIISQIDYFDKKIANDENTNGYYLVQTGDFVYNPRISNNAPCGPFNRYNGDQNGIMSPLYTVYRFEDKSLVYSDYLSHYFLSSKWHAYMNGIANYGSRSDRMNVLSEDMDNMPLPYPSSCEQQRIVEILSTQDKVIELYEKKIEQLQLLKKICLKKMFPKEGSSIPEVRFHGFTAPWEQRGLGEIASFSKGLGYSKNDIVSSGTPIILYGRLYTKYEMILKNVDTFVKAKPQSVYSHGGEVIIPASGETAEDISIAAVVKDKGVILGGDLNIVTPSNQIVSTFLALTITFGKAHKELSCFAQGKSVVHLHNSDLQKINILIPSIEEQKEISAFFLHLDNLITLQQQRRDEEKRKKKALMQLLLTGIVRV